MLSLEVLRLKDDSSFFVVRRHASLQDSIKTHIGTV